MNKRITRKIFAAFAVATFFVGGASAQILNDYVQGTGVGADAAETVDTVIVGTTTRLYAFPDPVYSPSYVPGTNANVGTNQRWTWYNGTDNTGTEIKAANNQNWIEWTWPATAQTYPVAVYESNTGLSCTDGGQTINVEVIGEPTSTYNTTDGTPVFYGTLAAPVSICETDGRTGTDYFQATFTHGMSGDNDARIHLHYTISVDTSNDGGATWTNIPGDAADYNTGGNQVTAVTVAGQSHNLAAPTNAGSGTAGFVAINGQITRYTYTLVSVTDRITRKCDWDGTILPGALTGWTAYDTTAETAAIVINPTPTTGPIYHISNTWAN